MWSDASATRLRLMAVPTAEQTDHPTCGCLPGRCDAGRTGGGVVSFLDPSDTRGGSSA